MCICAEREGGDRYIGERGEGIERGEGFREGERLGACEFESEERGRSS